MAQPLLFDDDLEECWRDLRPNLYKYTANDLSRVPAYISLGAREPDTGPRLKAALEAAKAIRVDVDPIMPTQSNLQAAIFKLGYRDFITRLVRAIRAQSRVRCQTIGRVVIGRSVLEALHDADIDPIGAFDEEFVASTFMSWADCLEHRWGAEERALFQVPDDHEFDTRHRNVPQRLLHTLLLGGVYGLFDHLVLNFSNLERLVHTNLLQSTTRRTQAYELDSLLEEIDRWNHHFSHCLTVVLGWSGQAEDATLLRGLCPPLMSKIDASKFRLP